MSHFRKKPVVIEAEQFVRAPERHFHLSAEFDAAVCYARDYEHAGTVEEYGDAPPHIHTLEGYHIVTDLDWIIKGVKGEFYPCKPDIFAQTYEAVAPDWIREDVQA